MTVPPFFTIFSYSVSFLGFSTFAVSTAVVSWLATTVDTVSCFSVSAGAKRNSLACMVVASMSPITIVSFLILFLVYDVYCLYANAAPMAVQNCEYLGMWKRTL